MRKEIILLGFLCFGLVGCSSSNNERKNCNTLISLKKNETLNISDGYNQHSFVNIFDVEVTPYYLSYSSEISYILNRATYSSFPGEVYYNGYYYRWSELPTTERVLLGNKTVTKETTYYYLPYSNSENIIVKEKKVTETSFDFKGGVIEKPCTYTFELSNYFASLEDLKSRCPDLANMLPLGNSFNKRYYVDTTIPPVITYDSHSYNSAYFYIGNNK